MLFSGRIPFHVAAKLTPIFWVPHLLWFATIRNCSPLFALCKTICTIHIIRYSGLFAFRYLTIRLRARVFYEQIVNEAQPSWPSLIENKPMWFFDCQLDRRVWVLKHTKVNLSRSRTLQNGYPCWKSPYNALQSIGYVMYVYGLYLFYLILRLKIYI